MIQPNQNVKILNSQQYPPSQSICGVKLNQTIKSSYLLNNINRSIYPLSSVLMKFYNLLWYLYACLQFRLGINSLNFKGLSLSCCLLKLCGDSEGCYTYFWSISFSFSFSFYFIYTSFHFNFIFHIFHIIYLFIIPISFNLISHFIY